MKELELEFRVLKLEEMIKVNGGECFGPGGATGAGVGYNENIHPWWVCQ